MCWEVLFPISRTLQGDERGEPGPGSWRTSGSLPGSSGCSQPWGLLLSALQPQLGLAVVATSLSLSCPPPKAGRLCPEGHTTPELTQPKEQDVPRAPGVFVTGPSRDQAELLPSLDTDTACGKPFTPHTRGRTGPHLLRVNSPSLPHPKDSTGGREGFSFPSPQCQAHTTAIGTF